MSKLRLDYFLMRGGKCYLGDVYEKLNTGNYLIDREDYVAAANTYTKDEGERFMSSFAQRENTGTQPVPEDFPVIVWFRNGDKYTGNAGYYSWGVYGESDDITLWKPDIEVLIEQQEQYDKKQSMYDLNKVSSVVYTQDMKDKDEVATVGMRVVYDLSKVSFGFNSEKESHLGEEMTVVANVGFNGQLAVLVSDDYGFSDIVNNTHYLPIKTRAELELEKAKENQLHETAQILCDAYCELVNDYSKTKEHFLTEAKALQDLGILKEITL